MSDLRDRASELYDAGRALLEAGDLPGAIDTLAASASEYPHFKTLELLGEAWLRSGDAKRAIAPLAAATALNAQVRAPSLLAEALLALGDELKAHEIAMLALERDPNNKKAAAVLRATAAAYETWSLGSG